VKMAHIPACDELKHTGSVSDALEDIAIWLEIETSEIFILWVEMHPTRPTNELSQVVLLHQHGRSGPDLQALACRGIEALGYRIRRRRLGTEIIGPMPTSHLSAHARLAAVSRVRTALKRHSHSTEIHRMCNRSTDISLKPVPTQPDPYNT